MESEFGKGLAYCLGLFLAHAERDLKLPVGLTCEVEMWFNGAADHLYEMVIPETFPSDLKYRLLEFQEKCFHWRLAMGVDVAKGEDKEWAIKEAKELLMLIDRQFGIETVEASWS